MKQYLLLLAIFSISLSIQSQEIFFSDLDSMPEGRSAISSAHDGENIYVCNGFSTSEAYTSDIIKYNIADDSWSTLTNQSIPKRFASAAIVEHKLYIFNGYDNTLQPNHQMEIIDLENGSITYSTQNPRPARAGGVATWDGKIYSFGGSINASEYSDYLTRFDPDTEMWTVLANMPIATETKGEIVDGKLYIFGGYNENTSNRIDVYDIATDTWSSLGTLPEGISAHATTVIGSKIWLIGDYLNLESLAYYDISDNTFQYLLSNMNGRRRAAAEGVNGNLYVIGGNTGLPISTAIASVQVSDLMTLKTKNIAESVLSVFPNPTTGMLNLDTQIDEFVIYDTNGKVIMKSIQKTYQINVSHLNRGAYVLLGLKDDQRLRVVFTKI